VLAKGELVADTIAIGDVVLYCPCTTYEVRDTKIIDIGCVKAIERADGEAV
jgi:hypothetical protein